MAINNYELSKELEYLLASYLFENKLQMKRLLGYLVHHSNSSSESAYDQRVIARECLGRSADFDPAENPVVRIEIGRLRKLLNRFYEEELARPYKISIPLGQYRPKVVAESAADKSKYLPELIPSPANPERLSVLLQFTTEGTDTQELYLLRHQIRIGITIALGRQQAVRLLVAIPSEDGKVADSIDFIMRVSLASEDSGFSLSSTVCAADSQEKLFCNQKNLIADYQTHHIDKLLSVLVSEFFDHEIGLLWREWSNKRENYQNVGASKVAALVQYQRYLFDENESNAKLAFFAVKHALEYHPGDKIINTALADIYYRMVIHGFDVIAEPVENGLVHVREALRFSPASEKLHILHAFLSLFQKECDFTITSTFLAQKLSGVQYFSYFFHSQVLRCLVSGCTEGFQELKTHCDYFSYYPKLFPVIAYLNYVLKGDAIKAKEWKTLIKQQNTHSAVRQCIKHMQLSVEWSEDNGNKRLLEMVNEDLAAH